MTDKKKNSPMKLWDLVEKSKLSQTKEFYAGRKLTTIDAYSQFKKATELFGPHGIGWSVRNEVYSIQEPKLMLYSAELHFTYDGQEGWFNIHSSMSTEKKVKGAMVQDDEVGKKIATDALTKGLSMLGFNADIFMGMFDNSRYVADLKEEEEKEKNAAKTPAVKKETTAPPPAATTPPKTTIVKTPPVTPPVTPPAPVLSNEEPDPAVLNLAQKVTGKETPKITKKKIIEPELQWIQSADNGYTEKQFKLLEMLLRSTHISPKNKEMVKRAMQAGTITVDDASATIEYYKGFVATIKAIEKVALEGGYCTAEEQQKLTEYLYEKKFEEVQKIDLNTNQEIADLLNYELPA